MTNILTVNQALHTGEYLSSANGSFFAVIQRDGKFCVYKGTPGSEARTDALWCSGSKGKDGSYFLIQQGDGNLVVYRDTSDESERYVWGTQVAPGIGDYLTILQDDGNLCVYKGTPNDIQGYSIWCSGVSGLQMERVRGFQFAYQYSGSMTPIEFRVRWSGGGSTEPIEIYPNSVVNAAWDPKDAHDRPGFSMNKVPPGMEIWPYLKLVGTDRVYEGRHVLFDRQSQAVPGYHLDTDSYFPR
jgi:hypothetical protein